MAEDISNTGENYELQKEYLAGKQREISSALFVSGAVARIVGDRQTGSGAYVDVEGVAQLDSQFVPSRRKIKADNGEYMTELSLTAVLPGQNSLTYSYFPLGQLDDHGILFAYPDVPKDDAESVNRAAQELIADKEQGVLPDLMFNLLDVYNPNTGLVKMPAPPVV